MIEQQSDRRRATEGDRVDAGFRKTYEPPVINTYSSEEIQEQAGPAMACSPSPCAIF